jgi:cytochrome c biogenesis protein CcdA
MNFIYEGLANLEAVSPLVYLLVFLGGVISAISICYIPVLVMFSGYMGGRAKENNNKSIVVGFIVGMVIMSAVLGIIAALIGKSIMTLFTGYKLDIWIPALIGTVMGTGTDIANESADITLLKGNLQGVVQAILLSREAFRIIKQNFIYAFIFNGIGIPFAMIGLLSPVLASLAMAVSSLAVVGNSMRLRLVANRKLFGG